MDVVGQCLGQVDVRARGALPIAMGPRILRTETAGIAAVAALTALWGGM